MPALYSKNWDDGILGGEDIATGNPAVQTPPYANVTIR